MPLDALEIHISFRHMSNYVQTTVGLAKLRQSSASRSWYIEELALKLRSADQLKVLKIGLDVCSAGNI